MEPSEATTMNPTVDWATELAEQLDFHWRMHLRPRLRGLSDAELHWEPDGAEVLVLRDLYRARSGDLSPSRAADRRTPA